MSVSALAGASIADFATSANAVAGPFCDFSRPRADRRRRGGGSSTAASAAARSSQRAGAVPDGYSSGLVARRSGPKSVIAGRRLSAAPVQADIARATLVLAVSVAERIVSVCLQARAGERVAVVTDEMPGHELVGALAASLRARGAEALVVAAERLPSTPHGYLSWVDPSTAVLALLSECDAAVFYTSTLSALAEGVRAVAARGTRMLFVPADQDLHRPFVLTEDLDALDTLGSRVCARLRTARELRLTTPEGTDLSLQTGGALGYDDCRAVEAGAIDFFPGGMWNLVPDVGSVEGVVRFCASLHPVGRLVEPVELEFSGGLVTSIHGGWQARAWQRWLDGFGESDVTRFAHLSGGLAAQAQVIGHDWEDLVVRGSVLVSGGASLLYGGGNAAPAHFDGIIPEATLVADGVPVLTSGTYAEDLLPDRVPRRDGQVAP